MALRADLRRWYDPAVDIAKPPATGFIRVVTLMSGSHADVIGLAYDKSRHVVINRADIPLNPEMKMHDLEELAGNDTDNTRGTVFASHSDVSWGGGASAIDHDKLASIYDGKTVYICYCPK